MLDVAMICVLCVISCFCLTILYLENGSGTCWRLYLSRCCALLYASHCVLCSITFVCSLHCHLLLEELVSQITARIGVLYIVISLFRVVICGVVFRLRSLKATRCATFEINSSNNARTNIESTVIRFWSFSLYDKKKTSGFALSRWCWTVTRPTMEGCWDILRSHRRPIWRSPLLEMEWSARLAC